MLLATALMGGLTTCVLTLPATDAELNPFRDLAPIALDGAARALDRDFVAFGELATGTVLSLRVDGDGVEAVLVLQADDVLDDTGVIVGGGPPNAAFNFRVPADARYFLFVQFAPLIDDDQRSADLTAALGAANYVPPTEQVVLVEFEPGYLSAPGLFDPDSQSADEAAFLETLSPLVASDVVARLQQVFAGTPIRIVGPDDPTPAPPFSTLRYVPDRVLAANQDVIDFSFPPPDPTRPECNVQVVFGQVLFGAALDPGNQVLDDDAVVNVGSFQGRGAACRTRITDSVANITQSLAQAGAHEIGHLVGLFHVVQLDVMNRAATTAFFRELPLARGQIQLDALIAGEAVEQIFPPIVQDPAVYFDAVFDNGGS